MEASGAIINVRGSKILKDHRGFYHLQEDEYKDLVDNPDRYFAVVFGVPEKTFVFSKEAVVAFFNRYPSISREGERPKWYFDIRKDNGNYYLKVHSAGAKEQNIDNYMNKWDQIKDVRERHQKPSNIDRENGELDTQYFLVQVNRLGSENLLRNNIYTHQNWMDTRRDSWHGKVRSGDILVV